MQADMGHSYNNQKTQILSAITSFFSLHLCIVNLDVVQALRCIGDLVVGHPANQVLLGSKMIGEEPDAEPALHCVLRSLLKATNLSECIAAEYVVKCYCEVNSFLRFSQSLLT